MVNTNCKYKTYIERKCGCCRESFYINNENINDAIYYDKITYHSKCFVDMCNKRSHDTRKKISEKWTRVLNNLKVIEAKSYLHFSTEITKKNIFEFIKEAYDITIIPTTVWQKLSAIYDGTFKGMSSGIPPEHLLDMWKKKIDMLNDIANMNITKGKKMGTAQRINYDLTILLNKYDSYLKWLEKQKIIEAENRQKAKSEVTNITTSIINIKVNKENISQKNDDISNLVDDIFDD